METAIQMLLLRVGHVEPWDDKVTWFENDGFGQFTEHNSKSQHCEKVVAADFDGDGDQDVASLQR